MQPGARPPAAPARPDWPPDYLWCLGVGVVTDVFGPVFYSPLFILLYGTGPLGRLFQQWIPNFQYQAVSTAISLLAGLAVARVLRWDPSSMVGRLQGVALVAVAYQLSSSLVSLAYPSLFGLNPKDPTLILVVLSGTSYGVALQFWLTAGLFYLLRRRTPSSGAGPGDMP
jgi:hypothetical protein